MRLNTANLIPKQKHPVHPTPNPMCKKRKCIAMSIDEKHVALNKSYTEQSRNKGKNQTTYIYT